MGETLGVSRAAARTHAVNAVARTCAANEVESGSALPPVVRAVEGSSLEVCESLPDRKKAVVIMGRDLRHMLGVNRPLLVGESHIRAAIPEAVLATLEFLRLMAAAALLLLLPQCWTVRRRNAR